MPRNEPRFPKPKGFGAVSVPEIEPFGDRFLTKKKHLFGGNNEIKSFSSLDAVGVPAARGLQRQ
jgi:hypothetical protein